MQEEKDIKKGENNPTNNAFLLFPLSFFFVSFPYTLLSYSLPFSVFCFLRPWPIRHEDAHPPGRDTIEPIRIDDRSRSVYAELSVLKKSPDAYLQDNENEQQKTNNTQNEYEMEEKCPSYPPLPLNESRKDVN